MLNILRGANGGLKQLAGTSDSASNGTPNPVWMASKRNTNNICHSKTKEKKETKNYDMIYKEI